jgi:hypothetical protein
LRLVAECDATITRWREVRNHVSAIEQQTRERCANDLAFSVQGCRP